MIFIIGKTCAECASFPVVLGMSEDCYLRKRAYFFKNLFLMAAIINNQNIFEADLDQFINIGQKYLRRIQSRNKNYTVIIHNKSPQW